MNALKKLSDLDFYILNTKNPKAHEIELVEKSFSFWQIAWTETFKSLGENISGPISSDDFLSRDAIALISEGEPVGLLFSHTLCLRKSQLAHSYFKQYPERAINQIKDLNTEEVMILSYMTCHPEWRKSQTDVPVSELLFSLGVKIFKSTNLNYLIACTRKAVGVHEITYRHGATKITEDYAHNVEVDYVFIDKQSASASSMSGVEFVAQSLWNKMLQRSNNLGLKKVS